MTDVGPMVSANSWGNRVGRPVLTCVEASSFGYRSLIDAHGLILTGVAAARSASRSLAEGGLSSTDRSYGIEPRRDVEAVIGLEALHEVEERPVEPVQAGFQQPEGARASGGQR
jgi:hypothetical protein